MVICKHCLSYGWYGSQVQRCTLEGVLVGSRAKSRTSITYEVFELELLSESPSYRPLVLELVFLVINIFRLDLA